MAPNPGKEDLIAWTAKIVASHLRNNSVAVSDLPDAIKAVYRSLEAVSSSPPSQQDNRPAVTIRRSVTPDYIVCLEDGKICPDISTGTLFQPKNPQFFGQDLWGAQGPVLPLAPFEKIISVISVSYTHLTLPTKRIV